jgi:hypothetical protein
MMALLRVAFDSVTRKLAIKPHDAASSASTAAAIEIQRGAFA